MKTKSVKKPSLNHRDPNVIRRKIVDFRQAMNAGLIERSEEIDCSMTSFFANEHLLLVGPPGVAKSMLLDGFMSWLKVPEEDKFDYLLTKFTDPFELFGPIDLQALKQGEVKRITMGMLPHAVLAFVDECFKGSSAILNTLLKVINERKYRYGLQKFQCPLRMAVLASNEYPPEETVKELGAFFDRILIRKEVKDIQTDAGLDRLLSLPMTNTEDGDENDQELYDPSERDCTPIIPDEICLTKEELDYATDQVKRIHFTQDAADTFKGIIYALRDAGITPAGRRVSKSVTAVQSYCFVMGGTQVECEHLSVLQHILWDSPQSQPKTCRDIVAELAKPISILITDKELELEDIRKNAYKIGYDNAAVKVELIDRELLAHKDSKAHGQRIMGLSARIDRMKRYFRKEYTRLKTGANV